jgi:hypothetical protein
MNEDIIKECPYVHDNKLISYQVDICNHTLQIFTQYQDTEKTSITFTGLTAHRFEYVTYCNIINGIYQLSIDYFINKNREMLEDSMRFSFPICAKTVEELSSYLKENEQKIFEIESVLGLSGFVIAKEISIDRIMI